MPVDAELRHLEAQITLNRPEKLNALDAAMNAELNEAWRRLAQHDI
jgi:enoyl-CoA hydratase/carnithine racemase